MKKTLLLLPLMLFGCIESEQIQTQQEPIKEKNGLELYKECMGYSDKTNVFTKENSERYIVLASEVSNEQNYLNKKEQGQVYYTSLLKCDTGKTVDECRDQYSLTIKNMGTKEKWKVGVIKIFTNSDFVYDKDVGFQFLSDGRPFSTTDYCYVDRNNLDKSYCSKFIHDNNNDICKDKKPK